MAQCLHQCPHCPMRVTVLVEPAKHANTQSIGGIVAFDRCGTEAFYRLLLHETEDCDDISVTLRADGCDISRRCRHAEAEGDDGILF